MSIQIIEAEELARRARLEQARHRPPRQRGPRPRTRVAATLRRVADQLDQ
ncbi:hypothetical protein [Nocardioides coralli]|nr:hypothetical protein [Nocardioides coralli]QZY28927.1 hypothetical protein K6T13_16015 [Nocardioides coralli]